MTIDSHAIIQAMVNAELLFARHPEGRGDSRRCVVTVSRDCGSRGEEIACSLAERLGLHCFDRRLVEDVARTIGVEPYLLKQLDENVRGVRSNWLERLVTRKSEFSETYRKTLIDVILGIGRCGGVIVGRGANFVLEGIPDVFRVRIVAPFEVRVRNYAESRAVDEETARLQVSGIDEQRSGYTRSLFERDIDDPLAYDIVMNSGTFSPQQIVEVLEAALERCGMFRGGATFAD